MKAKEFIIENKAGDAVKPRNFVAKNAMKTTSGAGAHKDKKRAEKQGDVKHKQKQFEQGVAEEKAGWSIKTDKKSELDKKGPAPSWRLNPDGTATDMNSGVTYNRDGSKKEGVAEVSKATLDRYVAKASDSHGDADFSARMSKNDPDKRSYHVDQKKTAEKRRQGISRALDRMSKEGVAEGKKPEHNLGTGWMLAKDKELGKKVAQNTDKTRREKEMMQKYAGKKDIEEAKRPDRAMPDTDLRVGDRVVADTSKENYPGGHKQRVGIVTRVGQKGVHIKTDDSDDPEWHPYKIVKKQRVSEGWGDISFKVGNWIYRADEEDEGDVRKMYHTAIGPGGKEYMIDFTPYGVMDQETFKMWVKSGMPKRQGAGPLDKEDIMKIAQAKGIATLDREMARAGMK